jgi:PDZ domain-containing protein
MLNRRLKVQLGPVAITLGPIWLVALPGATWAVAVLYLPIFAGVLTLTEIVLLTGLIVLFCLLSLLGHVAGHLAAARLIRSRLPDQLPLGPLGDAAHRWPIAPTAWGEALSAGDRYAGKWSAGRCGLPAVGPATAPLPEPCYPVSAFFNAGLLLLNLIPLFPLDGGRLLRAIGWGLLARPAAATRLAERLGRWLVIFLLLWAVLLVIQQARFSWVNGGITALLALLLWLSPVASACLPVGPPVTATANHTSGIFCSWPGGCAAVAPVGGRWCSFTCPPTMALRPPVSPHRLSQWFVCRSNIHTRRAAVFF